MPELTAPLKAVPLTVVFITGTGGTLPTGGLTGGVVTGGVVTGGVVTGGRLTGGRLPTGPLAPLSLITRSGVMTPDLFFAGFRIKASMAAPMPLVPAVGGSIIPPPIPPICTGTVPARPSSTPSVASIIDRKSTRLKLQSRQYLVCRLLLEK